MEMEIPAGFEDIAPIVEVAHKAGLMLLTKWPGNVARALEVERKSDGTFVTEADYASNEMIVSKLKECFPEDGIVSEEIARDENICAMKSVWIIDPLDGTQSFIDGKDDFSILIARVQDCQVTDSVMYFPAMDVMALAKKGGGAFINGSAISVADSDSLRSESVYIRNFETVKPEYSYPDHLDSGMAFLSVARGDIDGAIMRMGRHQEWDLAAPSLLIEEAGGKVTNELGEDVFYNQDSIGYHYFLASNGKTHSSLSSLIP